MLRACAILAHGVSQVGVGWAGDDSCNWWPHCRTASVCVHFKEQAAAVEFESQAEGDEKNAAQQLQKHTERLNRILALKQLASQL